MNEEIEVLPDPKRLIEGLRDTGYKFNTAIADIIDNSIAAEANIIDLQITMDFRGNVCVSIADNGYGMNREELMNAMKYGSNQRSNPDSLGKFGLGLKTASTAFCRRLSVLSRKGINESIQEATWDLDHVARISKWELLLSDSPENDKIDHLTAVSEGSGTVVVWDNIDRLMKSYKDPSGRHAQNSLKKIINELKEHIAMVYQRYIDTNDTRATNIEIRVNGDKIEAWDPFCTNVSELVGDETVPVELNGGSNAEFSIRAYILPRKEDFANNEQAKQAKLGNERQGIYIYRENRLIHDADWLGMYSKEPHGSLLRVEFSFDHKLDNAFQIDIKKSQIILDEELWNWLRDQFLTAPRREANARYRRGINKSIRRDSDGAHDRSNRNIEGKEAGIEKADISILDPATGVCEVKNPYGTFTLKLNVETSSKLDKVFIKPVDSLEDNLLFMPTIINGRQAICINTSHPYYHKVYVPNLSEGVTIQGMDSLLWALCIAEYRTVSDETLRHFQEMRFEVSRLLRKLVEDLPEPDIDDNATN